MEPYFTRGGIEIYHGNCLEIVPTLARKQLDLILTDPPYRFKSVSGGGFRAKIYDDPLFRELCNFDPAGLLAAAEGVQERINMVATCSRDLVPLYARAALERKWGFDLHVWHKPNAPPFINGTFKSDVEYVVLLYQSPRPFNKGLGHFHYSKVFTHGTVRGAKLHVTQKPLPLMKKYASILCPPKGRLLDPYMGSGTTLMAAKALGLRAIGIDTNERYCEAAAQRLDAK